MQFLRAAEIMDYEFGWNSLLFIIRGKCDLNDTGKSHATELQLHAPVPSSDTRRCVCT